MRQLITTQIARSNGRLHAIVPLDPKDVGRRLATARQRKHWTQLEFALKIGRSPASVSRWERGFLPPVRELMRIAEVLGIEPAELVEERSESAGLEEQISALQEIVAELRAHQTKSRRRS